MTNIDRKIAFLLATSPYLDTVDGEYDEAAMDLTANGVTIQKWISVKEDLPKNRGHYFIAYKFDGSDMRFYGEAMFHPEGGNGFVDRPHFSNEGVDGMYVTHWMKIPKLPLPEPPKEEEG